MWNIFTPKQQANRRKNQDDSDPFDSVNDKEKQLESLQTSVDQKQARIEELAKSLDAALFESDVNRIASKCIRNATLEILNEKAESHINTMAEKISWKCIASALVSKYSMEGFNVNLSNGEKITPFGASGKCSNAQEMNVIISEVTCLRGK